MLSIYQEAEEKRKIRHICTNVIQIMSYMAPHKLGENDMVMIINSFFLVSNLYFLI